MERGSRAQTTIDFAIAMGVFFVVLITVLAFIPNILQPFTGGQANTLIADRLAAQVTDDTLGDPAEPSQLGGTCTMYFFNGSAGDPCDAFEAEWNVTAKLGVNHDTLVNVSLRRNETDDTGLEIVCADGGSITGSIPCGSDTRMAIGPAPPNRAGSVTTARRYALLGEESVYVVVKVWA